MMILDDVAMERGGNRLMSGVSLKLHPGAVHAVIGPNGAGKTSLLRAMFGDLPIAEGRMELKGMHLTAQQQRSRPLPVWRDSFAYMPQDTHVDVALTVLEVVVLGRLGKLGLHIDDETLSLAIDRMKTAGILHLADRNIATLSGGQRQMALFAQVLMREPDVMLLDEPVSALDLRHQVHLLELVRRETRERGLITVVVLHDLNLACQFSDYLVVLSPGGLSAYGTPTEIISEDLIADTYGARVEILHDQTGQPVILPISAMEAWPASTAG